MITKAIIYRLLVMILFGILVEGKLRTYELIISRGQVNPNCHGQGHSVMLVNGQYPAPPLRATINDEVHVVVRNEGDEDTTVHYHGILQVGTTESDGMPNVTQAAIKPGGVFHHRFQLIGQIGTFFYHAHVGLQDESVQGPFIVYPNDESWPMHGDDHTQVNDEDVDNDGEDSGRNPQEKRQDKAILKDGPYEYHDERIVQLSEWWAESEDDRLQYYLGDYYDGFIAADQYLINGRGPVLQDTQGKVDDHCAGEAAIEVKQGEVYRVRVIGALTFATVGFSIARHRMTVIEVDGTLIHPYETDYLEVSSGQRFSVLLKADQTPASYNMGVQAYWITNTTAHGHGILNYIGADNNDHRDDNGDDKKKSSSTRTDLTQNCPSLFSRTTIHPASDPTEPVFPPAFGQWLFPAFEPLSYKEELDFQAAPDRTLILMPMEKLMKDKTTRWIINDHPIPDWEIPIIEQLRHMQQRHRHRRRSAIRQYHLGGDGYDETLQTYPMQHNEVVDVVIHTTTLLNDGLCAGHPWHSHGFQHYPIANGPGEYNHERDKDLRTYPHPVPKDTSLIYPVVDGNVNGQAGVPCGWTKLRVYANNPGLWAFHCHITAHMLQGMLIVVEMAAEQIKALQ